MSDSPAKTRLQTKGYLTLGPYKFTEWNGRGWGPLDIFDGFGHSSDTFFYQVAGMLGIDPTQGMQGVRELERAVRDDGFIGAHCYPHWFELAPDHAKYYPFYAKCCELGVPFQLQVGQSMIYAPDFPCRSVGRPITLDAVACDFPELKLIGIHVGIPWTDEMIAMAKVVASYGGYYGTHIGGEGEQREHRGSQQLTGRGDRDRAASLRREPVGRRHDRQRVAAHDAEAAEAREDEERRERCAARGQPST